MVAKCSSLFLVLNIFMLCESAFVDLLTKCNINDGNCEKQLLQRVVKEIAQTGAPEINLPPIDPIKISNLTVKILDIAEISLLEGVVKGAKDCIINRFETNIEDEKAFLEITCDATLKGKYKLFSSSPLIKNFLNGDTLRGEGNGKVKIEKLNVKFDFKFFVEKRDGEYYIKCLTDKTKYDYDIKGKMLFFADKIYVGDVESSKVVTGMLNQNWRLMMSSFGRNFMDTAVKYLYNFVDKFFDNVPAKYYISDDLSAYSRN